MDSSELQLDESQQQLLRVIATLLEQLGQLDSFLLRTSDSLLALFKRLDPDGTELFQDPEWDSVLLSIQKLDLKHDDEYLRKINANRATRLLTAPHLPGLVTQVRELYSAVHAGGLPEERHPDIHKVLAIAAAELPRYSLSTYRDWLVLAASTNFCEKVTLDSVTQDISSFDNRKIDKPDSISTKKLLLESIEALGNLMSTFKDLHLQRSAQNAITSMSRLIGRNSMPLDQSELYQLLLVLVSDPLCTDLPFDESTLQKLTPQDQAMWSDELVNLLFSVSRRFTISESITKVWFGTGFSGSQDLGQLSDRSITRLLVLAQRYLQARSDLVTEGLNRCFGDTGKRKDLQLLRRTCLVHADLGIPPIPQALRMVAETIRSDPTKVPQEQAERKVPALFALLWWIHTGKTDPELVVDGCEWIKKTCLIDQIQWSPRDKVRWQRIQEREGSTDNSQLNS